MHCPACADGPSSTDPACVRTDGVTGFTTAADQAIGYHCRHSDVYDYAGASAAEKSAAVC